MSSITSSRIKEFAREAGFDLCGIAAAGEFAELGAFSAWISERRHGEMKYMEARDESGELKRGSLSRVAPWARSLIVCAMNYNTEQPYSTGSADSSCGWISRYAWSHEDYHDVILRRLRRLEDHIREDVRGSLSAAEAAEESHLFRSYVDTGPLVERVYAKYAGVGWIGKNTCMINQKIGSWLFLGVILTSLDLAADLPAPDRCGRCTRCLDACPTHAFVAPGELDARRCISYLTIEKRGEIPEELRSGVGRHVFGCDICQDVCPWNRKAAITRMDEFQAREGLVNPALEWLAQMEAEEFRDVFRGSPIRRTKLSGLRRNAVVAMGNSGDAMFMPVLEKLCDDADPVVAEHARWARERVAPSAGSGQALGTAGEGAGATKNIYNPCMFQNDLLRGKRILITGGGTGLGKATAQRFLELGAEVYICGRREDVLAATAQELHLRTGGNIHARRCDVRDAAAVEEMVEVIWKDGALDVLLNNAAGNFLGRTEELSLGAFQSVIGIVLMGSLHATLACGRRWLAAQHPGVVLSVTTTYAETGSAYVVPSAVAKAGVQALMRSLAVEWGNRGIRMNAIAPGPIPTEGAFSRLLPRPELEVAAKQRNPLGRFGTVAEFANLAAFLVSDGAGYINGEVVTMDGGEWLQGAGEFSALGRLLTEEEWERMKPKKKNQGSSD